MLQSHDLYDFVADKTDDGWEAIEAMVELMAAMIADLKEPHALVDELCLDLHKLVQRQLDVRAAITDPFHPLRKPPARD